MKAFVVVALLATFIGGAASVYAHSGGTDRFGCHVDRRTGIKHCH